METEHIGKIVLKVMPKSVDPRLVEGIRSILNYRTNIIWDGKHGKFASGAGPSERKRFAVTGTPLAHSDVPPQREKRSHRATSPQPVGARPRSRN